MSKHATADPNDFSGVPDSKMRPWIETKEIDKKIEVVKDILLETMQMKSPQGGYAGASELDRKPDALIEFEKLVADDADWIGFDGDDAPDEDEQGEGLDTYDYPQTGDLLDGDMLLTGLIDDINMLALAQDDSESDLLRSSVTQSLIPKTFISNRSPKPYGKASVKNLGSIKFAPNFGGAPIHKLKELGVSSMKLPQNRNHYVRPASSSSYTRKDNQNAAKALLNSFQQRPGTGSSIRALDASALAVSSGGDNDGQKALYKEVQEALAKAQALEQAASDAKSALLSTLEAAMAAQGEVSGDELADAIALSPIKAKRGMGVRTASATALDSLSLLSEDTPPSPTGIGLGASKSTPELNMKPLKVRRASKSVNQNSPKASARFDDTAPASTALGKLGIGSNTGTATAAPHKVAEATIIFGKQRLKSIRTLRDQMMTTAGGMSAFARSDDPSQAKLFDAKASIEMTKKMVIETKAKGKLDNTWELLETPGYLKQMGPDMVFRSDTHHNYVADERYKKAIDPTTFDRTNGIPPSPLRIWAEAAVKSGRLPLFASGGALKTGKAP